MPVPAARGIEGRLAFVLNVPDHWYELDLEPATRTGSIRRLVEDRVRDVEQLWPERRTIMRLLEEQAAAAHDSGASYSACFTLPTDEGPVTGSVTVSLVMNPSTDRDDPWLGLVDSFREVPRPDDPLEPFAHTTMVDVPGFGSCPRSSGIEDSPLADGRFLRHVFMVTVVPVPAHDRAFVVAASSPVLPLCDALLDLFGAISDTFRVVELHSREEA